MRRQISVGTWEQIKPAFASGIGLRELARNMGIPEGTVLARASREAVDAAHPGCAGRTRPLTRRPQGVDRAFN